MATIKAAVIIKHPYRDWDWRVDIYEVEEGMSQEEIKQYAESKMLGPFEVIAVSFRISENNIIKKSANSIDSNVPKIEEERYSIEQAVEHLKNGGAIHYDCKNLQLITKILSKSFPQDPETPTGNSMFYFKRESLLKKEWGSSNTTNRTTIKLSQITESSPEKDAKPQKPFEMPEFDSPKNWTEDYADGHNMYICHCKSCDSRFYGYKRRLFCKECGELPKPTPQEQGEVETVEHIDIKLFRQWLIGFLMGDDFDIEKGKIAKSKSDEIIAFGISIGAISQPAERRFTMEELKEAYNDGTLNGESVGNTSFEDYFTQYFTQ